MKLREGRGSTDLCAEDVPLVVHVAGFLLQVELDPVVKTNYLLLSPRLPHKHVLETTRVTLLGIPRPPVQL